MFVCIGGGGSFIYPKCVLSISSIVYFLIPASKSLEYLCELRCWPTRWSIELPCLPPSGGQTAHPSMSTTLNYLSWTSGPAIAKSNQRWNNSPNSSVGGTAQANIRVAGCMRLKTHLFRVYLASLLTPAHLCCMLGRQALNGRIYCMFLHPCT